MANLTLNDVVCAYRKLKTMSYHDSSDLFLRWKISRFESDKYLDEFQDPKDRLEELFESLSNGPSKPSNDFWNDKFDEIDYYILPKEVRTFSEYEDIKNKRDERNRLINNIFTNIREVEKGDSYDVKKLTIFFDAPIEIYILSILWMMKFGYKLDIDLDDKCFGNRLLLREDNKGHKELVKDEGLFKPYFKQYQKWRDEGISMAKHYLDKGENVLFINLDIKNYYYSVRITKDQVDSKLEIDSRTNPQYINDLFWNIHEIYTAKIKKTKYPEELIIRPNENILPIGLPSSYVLANWYLKDFDVRVNEFINPVYYSRYVDDIFIVTAHNDMMFDFSERFIKDESSIITNISQLSANEKYVIGLLDPVLELRAENKAKEEIDGTEILNSEVSDFDYRFVIRGYEHLYIQATKTLVYLFDSKSSLALLDKFKNELEQRSSEFRFLPDDELNSSGFDDEAYELVFDDSQHKIKTLKDYKENRYGIASHLSKKIFYTLRNGSKGTDEDAKKIAKFFKGTNNIEHYRQWERLMTYFVINDKDKLLNDYVIYTLYQLEKLHMDSKILESKIKPSRIKLALNQQFLLSLNMALSLVPKIKLARETIKVIEDLELTSRFTESSALKILVNFDSRKIFRWSNMIRHSYVSTPLANYLLGSDSISLSAFGLEHLPHVDGGGFDLDKVLYSPRKVRFCEVAWMECVLRIRQWTDTNGAREDDLLFCDETYLSAAFENYFRINYWYETDGTFKDNLKKEIFEYKLVEDYNLGNYNSVRVHEISVNSNGGNSDPDTKKLKNAVIGLANMKVKSEDYEAAMLGRPNLENRYQAFAKILNMAEEESCNILILPELALPPALVKTFLDNSWSHQRCVVTGLEHWTSKNVAYNFVLSILPCKIRGIKDAVPVLRLKNHYSPEENFWIQDYRRIVPKPLPFRYHLFRWRGLYFSLYYCFELSDVFHRSIFKSKVDFLIASEWNPDTNYFSNIAEVSARDLHCYFIQVNTNQYGDSRIIKPSRTEAKDILRIKGGNNTTLLTGELEIEKLRYFQYKGYGQQKEDKNFKPTPADFNPDDVLTRQEGRSFSREQE